MTPEERPIDRRTLYVILLGLLALTSCGRGLTRESANAAVVSSSLIRATDNVSVDAISETSATEAIVKATIHGHTANLKLRRFDKGWVWEFVETRAGGWIAPEIAMAQIREEDRTAAAAKWADQNRPGYERTAKIIYVLALYNAPNPTELQHLETYTKFKTMTLNYLRNDKRPEMQERLVVLSNEHPTDSWGNEIRSQYDGKDGSTLIFSFGPDKVAGTADDLLCRNTFRRAIEDGREVWAHDQTWSLPEYLGGVLDPLIDKGTDRVEFTKVAKP